MIRLFVGIDLPQNIKEQLYTLRGGLSGANWRAPERMHLTLRFIGTIPEHIADEVLRELRYIRFPAFHMSLKSIGYFDVGGIPHHLWAGADNEKILQDLHDKVDAAIKRAGGGDRADFKFLPHVTLAKLQGSTMNDVFQYITEKNLFHTDSFLVDSFSLFISHARENGEGKYYTVEENYPLSLV